MNDQKRNEKQIIEREKGADKNEKESFSPHPPCKISISGSVDHPPNGAYNPLKLRSHNFFLGSIIGDVGDVGGLIVEFL